MKASVLIIDDEEKLSLFLKIALKDKFKVSTASNADDGLEIIRREEIDVVLLDLMIGQTYGIDVLKKIKQYDRNIEVIIMTAYSDIPSSVSAIKAGAYTYLSKPLDIEELTVFINQALAVKKLNSEISYLSDEIRTRDRYHQIIGKSQKMQSVFYLIDRLKDVDASVVILGESGTGKELAARALWESGKRSQERFVAINCAAIPENLLEAELFGHKKGAFTGALQEKKGKFEIANKGILFLDEIGDMTLNLQSKLLRVLQEREIVPLGSNEPIEIDVRVIAATNRNLREMVENGTFREDLYYRLNVMNITLPPLRERKEDIPLLCTHFIRRFNSEQNKSVSGISDEAYEMLMRYDYPGNVRQLANFIEYAMILCDGRQIGLKDLPADIQLPGAENGKGRKSLNEMLSQMTLSEIERVAILATLERNNGNRGETARSLGISPRGLYNKLTEYGIQ